MSDFDLDKLLGSVQPSIESPPERKWSRFQTEIFEVGEQSTDNILVQAVAGSGKSTTLRELTKYLSGDSTVLAFNKAIQLEMQDALVREGSTAQAKTFNGLGHGILCRNQRGARIELDLMRNIAKSLCDPGEMKEHGYALQRAVGLAKNNAMGISKPIDSEDFKSLFENYDLNIDSKQVPYWANKAVECFNRSIQDPGKISFDDQLWLPVAKGWRFPRIDNLLVDEFQDLTPIQHFMIDLFTDSGSRLVGVGDRHQAIYGFRGALSDSMDIAKERFAMIELPLSITYRCPRSVVLEAQHFCPDLMWRENAPEGELNRTDAWKDPHLFYDSLVMCRNNAPLFKAILRHVRAKSPCRVLTNFLESFKGFINGFKSEKTVDFRRKLASWYETESANAKAKKFYGRLESLTDKYETAKLLADEYSTTREIIGLLDRLALGTSGPTFATIHKAKGLEHDHSYLLRPDLIPARYATTDEQLRQEDNLLYVAITRAKSSFTYGETQE
jgi:superfamily I DNA/RNA helicase